MTKTNEAIFRGQFKILHIREVINGGYHRRTLAPSDDISKEPQEVQDACNAAWTTEVIEAYRAHLENAV